MSNSIASSQKKNFSPKIIAIAGGSGSGKTTAAKELRTMIGENSCKILSQDSYYHDQSAHFRGDGSINFDHPNAIDFKLLSSHLDLILKNITIQVPIYDFVTHSRKQEFFFFEPAPVVIMDGTLILTQEELRRYYTASLFLDIPEDIRFARRLKRDTEERGRTPEGVRHQFLSLVKPMHDTFVQPSQIFASFCVNNDRSLKQSLENLVSLLV